MSAYCVLRVAPTFTAVECFHSSKWSAEECARHLNSTAGVYLMSAYTPRKVEPWWTINGDMTVDFGTAPDATPSSAGRSPEIIIGVDD